MRKIWILAFAGLLSGSIYAKIKPVIHYNFGKAGNISFAALPVEVSPRSGQICLKAMGDPLFYADAPQDKAGKGEGSAWFDGKDDGYRTLQCFGKPDENGVLEVWVKARGTDTGRAVIVAHGNEKEGYVITQQGKNWILSSAGSGSTVIGEVVKDRWMHLAAVIEKGEGTIWVDGKKTGTFRPSKAMASCFSIAASSDGQQPFSGEIYEVRYSTFTDGAFDPSADFLLNYKVLKKESKSRLEARQALIGSIETPGMGKVFVSRLESPVREKDWLVQPVADSCRLYVQRSEDGLTSMFQLNNGLVARSFYVSEGIACISYKNLSNGAEYLRAVKPEARICIDSVWYDIGGLAGQPEHSYLLDSWYATLKASAQAFELKKIETGMPLERYPWHPKNHSVVADWPAKGLRLEMTYLPSQDMSGVKDIEIKINYEVYQGIPVVSKWLEVVNHGENEVRVNEMQCELLAVNQDQVQRIHVESDFSFALVNADMRGSALMHYAGDPKPYHVGGSTTKWNVDPEYNTWATHNQAEDAFLGFQHRNLLISTLPMGPDTKVGRDTPFKSFVTFELLQDSDDRERKSLAHRRMYKTLAPQTTESLIAGGITSHDEHVLKDFIDQLSEVGIERLDIQAWPGISHDNLDSAYVQHWRRIAEYAGKKGIIMGGYELQVASRGRGEKVDCIHPETGKRGSLFGQSVCIASEWKDTYYKKMWEFFDRTGLMTYNMDGPYHGDPCASSEHPHHDGLADSQWQQWKTQVEVLHELQRRNMYVPIPDWYFLNGQCSTGMGYREASANLTSQQQMLLGRQYIYDGTWHKIPTMGWMTLQLVGFYTNDPRVGLEPLCDNLDRYESQLMQFLGSGCQLTIRGNRIYDTPQTKQMVKERIGWFKKYRDILTSDIIHVSRPTGRDLDCIMHVNPFIAHKGMLVVFNPTDRDITKEMKLPLYYTGLSRKVSVTDDKGAKRVYNLSENAELMLPVSVGAGGISWFLLEE